MQPRETSATEPPMYGFNPFHITVCFSKINRNNVQLPVPTYRLTLLPTNQRTRPNSLIVSFNQYYNFLQILYSIVRFQILKICLIPIARRPLHDQLDSADDESPHQATLPILLILFLWSKFHPQHSFLKQV
jgi:hypothetical protein